MENHNIFEIINNRRSIRKFTEKEVSQEVLEKILLAGQRAPFAFQGWSVVYTRKKEKMKFKMGVYPSTKVLLFFLIDLNIIEKVIKKRGYEYDCEDANSIWLAIQDATLAAENVILAADAMGLGSVLLGVAPKRYEEIKETLLDIKGKEKFENKVGAATFIGKTIGERAIDKGIKEVVFDRNGFLYHGRVKAVSEGAREAGLIF